MQSKTMETNKKQDFNSLLDAMLTAYEQRGDKSVEEVVADSMQELGASTAAIDKAKEAERIIDGIQEKAASLAEAKERGMSREDWIVAQAYKISGGKEETAAVILSDINKAINERVEQEAETAMSNIPEKE